MTRPTLENPPANDLAGLRNQVRMVWYAADRGEIGETKLQLSALIDDLSGSHVRFCWMSAADRAASEQATRDGIAAYMAEQRDGL
jgi:hypothetical protein